MVLRLQAVNQGNFQPLPIDDPSADVHQLRRPKRR